MEIIDLGSIDLDATARQLLEDVAAEASALAGLGEFPVEVQDELERSFLPDRISDTLNIEGIRVNPRLTRAVLDGLAISESDRYTEQEILNVSAANELIESDATANLPLTPMLIRELHRRIENQLITSAGAFRMRTSRLPVPHIAHHLGQTSLTCSMRCVVSTRQAMRTELCEQSGHTQ